MTTWEKAGIIAAVFIGALEALGIVAIQAARTTREPEPERGTTVLR